MSPNLLVMSFTSRRPAFRSSVLCVVAAGLLAACGASTSISSVPDKTTPGKAAPANAAPSSSAAPAKVAKLGDAITIKGNGPGEQVQVTALKVANPSKGGQFDQPQAGKQYAAVQFRVVNTGTAPYSDSPSNGAKVLDADGQQFDSTILMELAAGPVMGSGVKLLPGKTVLGWIPFEVPTGTKLTGVQFSMNSGFGGTGEWELK